MIKRDLNNFAPRVHPIKWVLRYDPAMIGLVYKHHAKEKKKHLYQIFLQNLIFLTNPEDITTQLYYEHPLILNPAVIKTEQVPSLSARWLV